MNRVHLSLEAQSDLESIWQYIAKDDVDAADRWDQRLRRAFDVLAGAPHMGHRRTDLTDLPVLFWPVENYLIVYRTVPALEIVVITHGARDVPRLLSQRAI